MSKPDFSEGVGFRCLVNACDVWTIPQDKDSPHPAPFPVELAQRVIGSTAAQIVLNPFIGSGTTGMAAVDRDGHIEGLLHPCP
ncbi:MAG: DNA methyltransferase [Caldilineaceae bacterium]|nr:DNA methyltransferase [Caldilineaceae bacterium]